MIKLGDKKRGQVTVFVIAGIVILAIIGLLIFLINNKSVSNTVSLEENPEIALKDCIYDDFASTLKTLSYSGGSLNPDLYKEFTFSNEGVEHKISYLIYTQESYIPGSFIYPVSKEHLKNELRTNLDLKVEECFDNLVNNLENKGYKIKSNYNDYEINIFSNKIEININAELDYEKAEQIGIKKDFQIIFPTKFYELIKLAREICNQEIKGADLNRAYYLRFYPDIRINYETLSEGTKIYTLENEKTNELFRFATRSRVISI